MAINNRHDGSGELRRRDDYGNATRSTLNVALLTSSGVLPSTVTENEPSMRSPRPPTFVSLTVQAERGCVGRLWNSTPKPWMSYEEQPCAPARTHDAHHCSHRRCGDIGIVRGIETDETALTCFVDRDADVQRIEARVAPPKLSRVGRLPVP
jgi:hypothetical protein